MHSASNNVNVEDVQPEDLHALRETHKYIFFGPMRKDLKNTYFGAVYLFEKKLRFQAGQKVVLGNSKDVYGVALVGQAQNRQVWVWLVSFETEDVVKRLIVQVQDIVGWQTPQEREVCRNALARYQRRSRSYGASQSDSSPVSSPLSTRRVTRTPIRSDDEERDPKPKRVKRRITIVDEFSESEEDEDSFEETESESDREELSPRRHSVPIHKKQRNLMDHKSILRKQTGDRFMTLLECVVMTLAVEYPE